MANLVNAFVQHFSGNDKIDEKNAINAMSEIRSKIGALKQVSMESIITFAVMTQGVYLAILEQKDKTTTQEIKEEPKTLPVTLNITKPSITIAPVKQELAPRKYQFADEE